MTAEPSTAERKFDYVFGSWASFHAENARKRSTRGCLWQPVHHSPQTILQEHFIEIEQQAHRAIGEAKVGLKLFLKCERQALYRFDCAFDQ